MRCNLSPCLVPKTASSRLGAAPEQQPPRAEAPSRASLPLYAQHPPRVHAILNATVLRPKIVVEAVQKQPLVRQAAMVRARLRSVL